MFTQAMETLNAYNQEIARLFDQHAYMLTYARGFARSAAAKADVFVEVTMTSNMEFAYTVGPIVFDDGYVFNHREIVTDKRQAVYWLAEAMKFDTYSIEF